MTEEEVIKIITKIAKRLAPKFTFGYYDVSDIEQEAFLIGIDGLTRFDPNKGAALETFLFTHMNNRLKTFKRDNYCRISYTCNVCNNEDPNCEQCVKRQLTNERRKSLMEPMGIESLENESIPFDIFSQLEINEISTLIDKYLELEYRLDYLKMLDGVYIPKIRKIKIEQRIIEILEEHGHKG